MNHLTDSDGVGLGERVARELAGIMSDEEWAAMFSPAGLARQCQWQCEDDWIVGYTTGRIYAGEHEGKFAVMAYRPAGRGARSGNPSEWRRVYFRTFARRKSARSRAEQLYYRHSPRAAMRHGVATT